MINESGPGTLPACRQGSGILFLPFIRVVIRSIACSLMVGTRKQKQIGRWQKKIQGITGKAATIGWILLICIQGTACNKNRIPQNVEQCTQTIELRGGVVRMYNNSNFTIPIPTIEVQSYEVTNAAFKKFIESTGYITTAEKNREGMVFDRIQKKWILIRDANWQHPQGPQSTIENKDFYPVVQVSYLDACAYCDWLNMRLPYESEWEYLFQNEEKDAAKASNHWDGIFPLEDKGTDGYKGTSPVGSFGKGGAGCYDVQGNVWEWCNDYYHDLWPMIGVNVHDSIKYTGPAKSFSEANMYDTLRVVKGGSFLCADNYCRGYTNQIRMSADPNLGYEHIGFRCVKNK